MNDVYLNHLMTIILSVFLRGYRGKTVDFQEASHCHRTISNRSSVFSPITFKRPSGLRESGCFCHAFLQWDYPEFTDVSLSTLETLEAYIKRWPIELFFRQSKTE